MMSPVVSPPLDRSFSHRIISYGCLILLLCSLPLLIKDIYTMHLLNILGIYILLTTGLNLVLGVSGQISVGHAAFWGLGAYASALLTVKVGLNFWMALFASGTIGALTAFVIGPVLRLKGHVLAVATIALGEIVRLILLNWVALTNGPAGFYSIPAPSLGSIRLDSDHSFYYVILGCVLLNLLALHRLVESRLGKMWLAIRDDQEGAESVGVFATKLKIYAFGVAGFSAGLAGSLYAHLTSYISPHIFTLHESLRLLTMIVVGGEGSMGGAILGSSLLTLTSEYSRSLQEYSLIPYGLAMLLCLIFAPKGMIELLQRVLAWLMRTIRTAKG
jgi:branched-chain amino acid transport system permease protein